MTALEQLERLAARVGWKLHWGTDADVNRPTHGWRVLDIYYKGQAVLLDGPFWVYGQLLQMDRASEIAAAAILSALPRRGARA
jgi:hypothetical protein